MRVDAKLQRMMAGLRKREGFDDNMSDDAVMAVFKERHKNDPTLRVIDIVCEHVMPVIRDFVREELDDLHTRITKGMRPRFRVQAATDEEPAMSYKQLCEMARRNRQLLESSGGFYKAYTMPEAERLALVKRDREVVTELLAKPRIRVPARTSHYA